MSTDQHKLHNQVCIQCQNPSDENMTTCTVCHNIIHRNCVEAADDITIKCLSCSAMRPNSPSLSTSSRASNRFRASQSRIFELQLQKLEEERQLNKKYLDKKYQLLEEAENLSEISSTTYQSVRDEINETLGKIQESENQADNTLATNTNYVDTSALNRAYLTNNTTDTATILADHTANNGNTNSSNLRINNQPLVSLITNVAPNMSLAEQSNYITSIPNNFSANIKQSTTNFSDPNVIPPNSSRITSAVPNCTTNTATNNGYQQRMQLPKPTVTTGQIGPTFNSFNNNPQGLYNSIPQEFISQPKNSDFINTTSHPSCQSLQPNVLKQNHLSSRQSLPNELPIFSGQPDEWPIFYSTYQWSTAACAFSNAENLIRIRKALKGEAYHSVQHMLVHPSNVPGIIQTLLMLFGQPEKIINAVKERIKLTPKVDENNLKTLTSLAINVRGLLSTITAANLSDELNNSSLLQDLIQKLPPLYQMQWAMQKTQLLNQYQKPNLYEFDRWLFNIGITASSITVDCANKINKREKTNSNNNKGSYVNTHTDDRKCFVCNNNKCTSIANCKKFVSLNRGEKWNIIRKYKLCKICLFKHSGECKKKLQCGVDGCEYYHHSSLHGYSNKRVNNNDDSKKSNIENSAVINAHKGNSMQIMFKILPITIYGNKKEINTFAFIDEGSSISLMDESLINELGVHGSVSPLCLKWTGGIERCENNSQKLKIKVSGQNKKTIAINVNTVSSLKLPVQSLNYQNLAKQFPHLRNLPIENYENAVPKILIGLNNFNLGISTKIRQGAPHEPVAVCTKIGWLIYGVIDKKNTPDNFLNLHECDCEADVSLDEMIKSFYSLDSIGICCKDPLVSKDDDRALSLLNQYTRQKTNGHYETPLLWRFDVLNLPDSFGMAMKRLLCLERKLLKNIELHAVFKTTIEKYLRKGYIRKLNKDEMNTGGKVWYLPIFAVFNKNKPGKSRVVWDAAATTNGLSLNSFLLKGPDLLASLPSVLFSFRKSAVAICGDIEEMFHQIFIRPEDRNAQRFLWRNCDQSKEPEVYIMDVMIFGATCAPSISQYIKNLNAEKFVNQFPEATEVIKKNHYVDDLLYSVDTPQEAINLIKDVKYIHCQGGFNIRNWISNNEGVLNAISDENISATKCLNLGGEKQIEKVLGVFWEHQEDVITFKIAERFIKTEIFSGQVKPTKREMLRLVMSIYDPLGLIGNIIMYVKILLQEVWRHKVDWDEEIPLKLMSKWTLWLNFLPNIEKIKIPRCYLQTMATYDEIEVQLHTFVDASKDGYAAVSYFRMTKNETIICSIIGSKTRVAPLKITSIPRLELMAALIGARFAKFICEKHKIKVSKKFFWSDSKTVISWINSDHRRYNQFVAFRVSEILELSSITDWRWITSKQNVADEATKWTRVPEISNSNRWFAGPDFLYHQEVDWPVVHVDVETTLEETTHFNLKISSSEPLILLTRFSKWIRILRTAAFVFRFITNCLTKHHKRGEFSQEELLKAECYLYHQVQKEDYGVEISCLKSGKFIPKSSEIYKRSPILDKNNVLRADSRLNDEDIFHEQKQPIILPKTSYITSLIILHYHQRYHHTNHETVINEIRQKYSIAKLRVAFKSTIRKCQWCKIYKAVPKAPQMAKLPKARLAAYTASFTYTGVDFFGPLYVTVNRHKEKRYGVLFTCLTVRAVHIEVAHSLTTSSCILAIRNFMARRGIPREFFSDNGTNFIGAERELREALIEVDKNEFIKTFTSSTTTWNFNPPGSPHMGGAWERLVRSIKTVLYKILPSRAPSDELLLSMLLEVENIVNSRPLAYVPVDDTTSEAVTPNHFLVGSSSGLKPLSSCNDSGIVLKQNWLLSQQYANIFWKKWLTEYLPTITCRSKWFEKQQAVCQGNLVIVVDPSLPRNTWLRGRVIETRLAKDGQVRSAKVLTTHGILERPVVKLAVLDVASLPEFDDEDTSCQTAGGIVVATDKNR